MTTIILGCPGCTRPGCPVCTVPQTRQRRHLIVDPNICGACGDRPVGGVGLYRDLCRICGDDAWVAGRTKENAA